MYIYIYTLVKSAGLPLGAALLIGAPLVRGGVEPQSHMCVYVHIYIYIYMYTHVCITYIYIYIHTYLQDGSTGDSSLTGYPKCCPNP